MNDLIKEVKEIALHITPPQQHEKGGQPLPAMEISHILPEQT
jgi:hypothetical protein